MDENPYDPPPSHDPVPRSIPTVPLVEPAGGFLRTIAGIATVFFGPVAILSVFNIHDFLSLMATAFFSFIAFELGHATYTGMVYPKSFNV